MPQSICGFEFKRWLWTYFQAGCLGTEYLRILDMKSKASRCRNIRLSMKVQKNKRKCKPVLLNATLHNLVHTAAHMTWMLVITDVLNHVFRNRKHCSAVCTTLLALSWTWNSTSYFILVTTVVPVAPVDMANGTEVSLTRMYKAMWASWPDSTHWDYQHLWSLCVRKPHSLDFHIFVYRAAV